MRCSLYLPLTVEKPFCKKEEDYEIAKYNWGHWWELAAFAARAVILRAFLRYDIFLLKYKCHHSCHQELIHYH